MDTFSGWMIKNLNWIVPTCITTHAGILAHLLIRIDSKVGRTEFDSRLKLMEDNFLQMNIVVIEISRQNGEIVATLKAQHESSRVGDDNIKELLQQLVKEH